MSEKTITAKNEMNIVPIDVVFGEWHQTKYKMVSDIPNREMPDPIVDLVELRDGKNGGMLFSSHALRLYPREGYVVNCSIIEKNIAFCSFEEEKYARKD